MNSYDHYKISPEQIILIYKALKDTIQFKLSLRQIKCLLKRITRFCINQNYETDGFKKIPVIYVLISYIIPQLKIGENSLEELLKYFDSIMKYNNLNELKDFISSEVKIETIYEKGEGDNEMGKVNYIRKGKVFLRTKMKEENLPQVLLQTYFWIRMSCRLENDCPCGENLLLAGPTSYKEYILNKWLKLSFQNEILIDTIFLSRNTETENLIGLLH